ncbi:MAG: ribonuclease R [Clostridia bacterium]|nr:ribonuclease R [Clostridia bacterium]
MPKKQKKEIKIDQEDKEELLNQKILGTYEKSKNFGFVVPDFKKLPTDIFVSKKNSKKAKNGQKVLVQITKVPKKGKSLEGNIIDVIGSADSRDIEMKCLVKEYDVPEKFPKEVILEAKAINQLVDKKDIPNRVDFRDLNIFTIDGEDSKDLDDAVSVSKDENGIYTLGVYIADVSYYVKPGTNLDKEALKRGTSIYMLDRVIPMLPFELSNGICSLNAGEDRFVLAITMKIDKKGIVKSSKISKGIINVKERMTYTNVAKIIENSDNEVTKRYEKYITDFKLMEELAHILKKRRMSNGSLNLNIPETKIEFDENGKVIDIRKYELSFANEIIEQFMLTANEEIAETFYNLKIPFIYRVHEVPDVDKIEELNKFLFDMGYKIKVNKKGEVSPKEFAEILNDIEGKPEEKVISTFILRTLKIARYESENKGHFGIASKYYCHFTSPIRRYPDLFIHRVISEYLNNNNSIPDKKLQKFAKQATSYAEKSSEREKIAQTIEREAEDIKKAEFMEDKIGEEFDGIISGVTQFGVFVELENTVEGLIRFENLADDYFEYNESKKMLIGEHTGRIFKIGDCVKVRVIEASKLLRRVSFELVNK